MDASGNNHDDETIGDLFGQLIEDGADLVRAEVNVYRRLALLRLAQARIAIILGVCGLMLVMASIIALLLGLVLGLAKWVGPVGAGVLVTLAALAIGGLLLRFAVVRLGAVAAKGSEGAS